MRIETKVMPLGMPQGRFIFKNANIKLLQCIILISYGSKIFVFLLVKQRFFYL